MNKGNKHAWFRDHIEYYFSGDLDFIEKRRFESHLRKCGKCRKLKDDHFMRAASEQGLSQVFPEPADQDAQCKNCFSAGTLEAYAAGRLKKAENKIVDHHLFVDNCVLCNSQVDAYLEALRARKPDPALFPTVRQFLLNLSDGLLSPINSFFDVLMAHKYKLAPVFAVLLILILSPYYRSTLQITDVRTSASRETVTMRGEQAETIEYLSVKFSSTQNCYAYLFDVQKNKSTLIAEKKALKNTETILTANRKSDLSKAAILLISKKPFSDLSAAKQAIHSNIHKDQQEIQMILKKQLKKRSLIIRKL